MGQDLKAITAAVDRIVEEVDRMQVQGGDRAGLDSAVSVLRSECDKLSGEDKRTESAPAQTEEPGDGAQDDDKDKAAKKATKSVKH